MENPAFVQGRPSIWLSVATILFAGAIFVVDTFTPLDIAVAVLYVVVVLMAANLFQRRGLLFVAGGCLALTVTSFLVSHGFEVDAAFFRCLVSLSAILITTILALANQTTTLMLREQAELLDLTHDTVLVRDMQGEITYWNRAAEELYGWSFIAALGRQSHDLLQTVFPAPQGAIEEELLRTGRWEGELVHTARDGKKITVSSRWALERDARGQPKSVLETNTDITARSKAQQELQEAQSQLAHVTRVTTLGELAASIAHEVNQPLAAIVTNGEVGLRWLDRQTPDLAETRGALNRMIAAARRASDVIARLRALSRRGAAERAPLDIGEVVNEVVVLIHRELVASHITLRVDLDPARPLVTGDRVQLQQVIMNLLVNGIQAMTSVDERKRELLVRSQRHEDDQILVSVQDAGVGISEEDQTRLFQAFYTTKKEGMGMGLSISRSIVESHGGRIWVTRNAVAGATFQFALPSAEAEPPGS